MILQPVITQMQPIKSIFETGNSQQANAQTGSNQIPFANFLGDAMNDAIKTSKQADAEIQKVVLGETDDTFSANIAAEKASLSLEMFVQVRNKALEAYQEIMRMNV
ncbi:MAG: flagellar hook-basal body complex protein FliE [Oscillospiraceae bacterium]